MDRVNTGRGKIFAIAVLNVALPLISGGANLLVIIVMALISVFLYRGVSWIKYLFVILSVLHTFTAMSALINPELSIMWKLFYLIYGAYRILSIILVLSDKSIKEFWLAGKNNNQA